MEVAVNQQPFSRHNTFYRSFAGPFSRPLSLDVHHPGISPPMRGIHSPNGPSITPQDSPSSPISPFARRGSSLYQQSPTNQRQRGNIATALKEEEHHLVLEKEQEVLCIL